MVAVLFIGLSATACEDATGPEQLESLTLTSPSATVQPTATVQLTAVGTRAGQDVTNLLGQTYTVVSGGGTVSSTGAFTAPATAGTSTIMVSCGGRTANVSITVVAGPLARITVTPNPITLGIQTTQQFTAVGHDAFDNVVAITPMWTAATQAGMISGTGVLTTGNTLGTFATGVTATSGSISGTASVTIIAGPLATITVTPNPVTLAIGAQQQFTAIGRDAGGNQIPITPVWSSTNPPGTINASTGLFTAGNTLGTFANSVRATSGSISGAATVTVIAGPLASITVTPNPTLRIGEQQQFTALGRDAGGNEVPVPAVVWSATNPPGTINAGTGLFTAGNTLGTFPASVTATSGSISGTATVTVIAGPLASMTITPNPVTLGIGMQQQFTATGRDAGGNQVPVPAVVWSATNPPGTIDAGTGLFTAGNTLGTYPSSVTATSGSISATATVTVIAGPLASITVTPNPVTLAIGAQQQFTAVGRDAGGNEVPITAVWSTTNPPGTINASTGLFTAGNTIGTFPSSVTATSGSISGSATVTVTTGPLAMITVTPNPVTLAAGAQQQFTATGQDAGGNPVAITPVWSATNPPGTINASTGLFTAGNTLGTFPSSVTATSGGISGSATVTVVAGPLATITVTPNPATLAIGAQQQFTAVGRDAGGNVVPITPVWSSTNPPGTINAATGLFTAGNTLGTFANSVRATVGAVSGSATVNVVAGPLATITVTPNPETLAVGAQQQFTAVGRDAGGNVVTITPVWSTTNPPGTINAATGLFTAGNTAGTFPNSVRATSGAISGAATVTVVVAAPAPLATITVTPNPTSVETNGQRQFTAVGRDANGVVVPITPVWSTTNPPGTINAATGLFTAGNTTGTFTNSVRATQGAIFGTATVTVTAPVVIPPPIPAAGFRLIARTAITCTTSTINGDVATNTPPPLGLYTQTGCVTTGVTALGTVAAQQAFTDFLAADATAAATACGVTLTGTLAGVTLSPGVYCFDSAATLTGTLTLNGGSTDRWLFKIGAAGLTGALTTTNFTVEMAGTASPCNVTWRVLDAVSITGTTAVPTPFLGNILAGGNVTITGASAATPGIYKGNAWSKADVTVTNTTVSACGA